MQRSPPGAQYTRHKGAVQASAARRKCAGCSMFAWNLFNVLARKIAMGEEDRSIDETDADFRTAARAFHQCCELNDIHRLHRLRIPQRVLAANLMHNRRHGAAELRSGRYLAMSTASDVLASCFILISKRSAR